MILLMVKNVVWPKTENDRRIKSLCHGFATQHFLRLLIGWVKIILPYFFRI